MMQQYNFNSNKYSILTIIAGRKSDEIEGSIKIVEDGHSGVVVKKSYTSQSHWYEKLVVKKETSYLLQLENVDISYMYLSGNDDVYENGICFLEIDNGQLRQYDQQNIGEAYQQKYRNRFHFSPFKNWMNDPCGLTRFRDRYHIFYQKNPADLKWGPMYWGHATSTDLIHWTHLPIVFFPQDVLFDREDIKGGAYTGSAVANDKKITFYFTRCLSPHVRGPDTVEYQVEAYSDNGVDAYGEHIIINSRPKGKDDYNFRDPKLVKIEGVPYLLVAATYQGICSILRYMQDERGEWKYKDIVLQDRIDCDTYECINYIPSLDNSGCAFICSLQNADDPYGRKRLTYCYIGELKNGAFAFTKRKLYDFGTSAFAMQTMELEDRTLIFGWVGSFYGEFKPEGSKSNGCLTLPREIYIKEGTLHTVPAKEVKELNDYIHTLTKNENIELTLPHYRYRVDIEFSKNTDFHIILAENNDEQIGLAYDSGRIRILNGKKNGLAHVNLFEDIEQIRDITVFVDHSVVEIFINDGTVVGTKVYFIDCLNNRFSAKFRDPNSVTFFKLTMLKSIW